MALGRYKTFADAVALFAAELNGLQDWFTGNAATLISPFTNTLNANSNQITNLVIETASATPSATPEGRMVYHTGLDALLVVDGSAVRYVPNVSGGLGSRFHTLRMNSAGTGQEYATTSAAYANLTGIGTIATQNLTAIALTGSLSSIEMATPSAPASNSGILFFADNGAGKTQLQVRFPTGVIQVLATEP